MTPLPPKIECGSNDGVNNFYILFGCVCVLVSLKRTDRRNMEPYGSRFKLFLHK